MASLVVPAAVVTSAAPASGAAKKLTTFNFRTDYLPNGFYTPIVWALKKGYYKDEGLNFQFNYGKGSTLTTQDVGQGRMDAGDVSSAVAIKAVSEGVPVRSVGAYTAKFQFGFFVPKDSDIKNFKDFQGKSVISEAASPQNQLFPALFKLIGIPADSVQIIQVNAAAAISTYAHGSGDSIAEAIPFGAPQIQPLRPSRVLPWADAGLVVPDYSLVVNESVLKDHPDEVAGFLRATYKGIAQSYAHPSEAIDLYSNFESSVKKSTVKSQFTAYKDFFCSKNMTAATEAVGFQNAKDWSTGLDVLQQYEGIPTSVTANQVMTNQFFSKPYNVASDKCPLGG